MSLFDPEQFMEQTVEGELSTSIPPVTPGEYPVYISDVEAKVITSKETGKDYFILEYSVVIDSEEARQVTGLSEPKARGSVFLDVTAEGGLDTSKGKNIDLGRLRAAVGQNIENMPWKPNDLIGAALIAQVGNRPDSRPGNNNVYNEVEAVRAA